MTDVSFDEDIRLAQSQRPVEKSGSIVALVKQLGLAQTDDQAYRILMGIAALTFIVAGYIFFSQVFHGSPPPQIPLLKETGS